MADIVISVVGKLAEYTIAPLLRQCGYLIYYERNVENLTEKVTTLTATRDGVQLRVDGAKRNLEVILPEVENWLERVQQTIQEKETCFEKGRVAKATTCCSSNGWCPNLKGRHSLSRKAAKMAEKLDKLITDGNFTTISCPARPPKLDYPAIPYYEDSTHVLVKPHEGASSSSGTSKPAKVHVPMDLSERLEYRLPYTKDLLTALQDDKISMIGISGTFREIDMVTTKEFTKRMKHRNLFDEVVMAVVSQHPDLKRIQDEIAEMLDLKLEENGSLVERAERLQALLLASGSKRILVILTDVCGILDLDAIGIPHLDIMESCKIVLISELQDVFGEMETQSNFRLILHSTPRARPVEFESRISIIRDVMDALTDDESNPIVIWGMGGIGKTTLVMEIGAKADEVQLFDEIAVAEFTQEPDLIRIQGQIGKALGLDLTGEEDRAAKLRERLSRGTNNVLLILDNVWTQLNLWEIGIPISRDKKCCKLLVTSRDQDIFKEMKTRKPVPIGGLPKPDGWSLFKKVAGDSIESDLELRPIAEQVLAECDGLPVAISTVGRALQGKSISSWRDALRELRDACPENVPGVIKHVYRPIMLSYECLPSEQAKSCFLLCCLFPESENFEIEELVRIAIGLGLLKRIDSISQGRDRVETLVGILKSRSLLLDGRMHDVVRDVAVYIAYEEFAQKKNDESEKRIVLRHGPEVNQNNFVYESGSEESAYCRSLTTCTSSTELLLIRVKDRWGPKLKLPATILDGMEDLKVLLIWRSILPSLPLLKNIQTLVLVVCHLNFNVDVIGELQALMILDLSGSDIKQLPDTFKNLSNLRVLNLSRCGELKVISPGVISSLSRLEELRMLDSFEDWVVEKLGSAETTNWISQLEDGDAEPEQVDMWKRLNRLAVEKPASTETTTDRVSQLEDDESSKQEEVNKLFRDFVYKAEGNYDQVTRWANSMDWRVGLLSELLSLSRLTTLEVVLPPIEIVRTSKLFHNLDRFGIPIEWGSHAYWVEGNSLSVEDLDLAGTGISLLLKKTKNLELKMKSLTDPLNVWDVNCCATLKSLTLQDCDSLEYLIDTTLEKHTPPSVFPVLDYLSITRAKRLKEIFHGDLPPSSLQKLEVLTIGDCQSVEAIFGLEGSEHHVKEINFLSLTHLALDGLPCFTGISKSRLNRQLEVSSLYRDSLTDEQSLFSDPKFVFPVLTTLFIECLGELKKIWNGQLSPTSFSKLESLTVLGCDKLLHLVPTQMQNRLQTLVYIRVEECSSLEGIFEVRRLTINERIASVSRTDKLPSNISQPDQGMQINDIMGCKQSCLGFQNLTELYIRSCGSLRYLLSPSIARGLVKLQILRIENCQKMEAIFGLEGSEHHVKEINFLGLTKLELKGLPCFTGISKSRLNRQLEVSSLYRDSLTDEQSLFSDPKFVFPVLTTLFIECLGELKKIWNGQLSPTSFSKLESLTVLRCDKLLHLVPTQMQNRLQTLVYIRVEECSSLEGIFEVRRLTVNERIASVSRTDKLPSNISQPDQGMQINDIMGCKQSCLGFQNLTELYIRSCGSLRYLLSPSIARGLVKLQILRIENCQKMEAIFGLEGSEHHVKEINFLGLTKLELKGLPCFTGISKSRLNRQLEVNSLYRDSLTDEQSLFSDPKVIFPVLKNISIELLGELKKIWNGQLSPTSFSKLESLTVLGCDKLLHLVPTQMQNRLQTLKRISVNECSSLEGIFEVRRLTVNERIASVSRTDKLPSNISQPDQGMQINDIMGCTQSCQGFQNLTELYIRSCGSLRYLLSPSIARGLVKLQILRIESCQKMEAIFGLEGSEHHVKEINFPGLTKLELKGLPCFTGISKSRLNRQLEVSSLYRDSLTDEQSLFSDPKVIFPVLKYLFIDRVGELKKIWDGQLSPASFSKLESLTVFGCDKLLHLVPTQMQNRLQTLKHIGVHECSSLEGIFEVRRLTVNERIASVSRSDKLPSNISQPDQGMQINDIMGCRQSCQGFQNLATLYITSCGSLRYLLSPSIARGLVKLQILRIENCQKMEAIVAADEGEETENESMLPRLD